MTGGSALSLAELSRRTGLSRSAVLRRLRSGEIDGASRRDDGRWEIPESAVEVMLDERAPATEATDEVVVDVVGDDVVMDLRTDAEPDVSADTDVDVSADADLDVSDDTEPEPEIVGATSADAEIVPPSAIRATDLDVRPPTLDLELERGLRSELADARRQAAVAEAVASERLDTIETLRDALETIRQMLPAVGEERGRFDAVPLTDAVPSTHAALDADDDEYERFGPAVSPDAPSEPAVVVEARDVAEGQEWVWQTSAPPEPKSDLLRRIFRRR